MSNVEHLFENALVALENDYYFGEWKRIEKDRHNPDGVSEEVIEAIWELAIYTKYTYEPSLKAIPVEWIKDYIIPFQVHHDSLSEERKENDGAGWVVDVLEGMLKKWEKEHE